MKKSKIIIAVVILAAIATPAVLKALNSTTLSSTIVKAYGAANPSPPATR